jgi:parallel beta-helix repeat protein
MKCGSLFLSILLLCIALAPAAITAEIQVDDNAPGDPGPGSTAVSDPLEDGTAAHPYDAIQEAIDASLGGDTVLVADGTYTGDGNRDMDFGGRRITVRSVNGPAACTIDAQGGGLFRHRVFTFQHGEGRNAVVQGFTITGGYMFNETTEIGGGAILITNGSPTITGNIFTGNSCYFEPGDNWYGGAIHCGEGTVPLISGNTFTDNLAHQGGAIGCSYSAAVITGNSFSANDANRGSAIHCFGQGVTAVPVITHNTIANHPDGTVSGTSSAAVWIDWVNAVVSWNEFTDNGVHALWIRNASPTVEHNTFSGNTFNCIYCDSSGAPFIHLNSFTGNSGRSGVGVTIRSLQNAAIIDNYFFDNHSNHSDGDGGAISIDTYGECTPLVLGNVIVGNSALDDGGGISSANNAAPIIAGNIISGNQAGDRGGAIYTSTDQWHIVNNLQIS